MKKFLLLFTALCSVVALTSCQVNWFGETVEAPWYAVVLPRVLFIVITVAVAYLIILSRTYVCPECKTEIKPKWNDFSICIHMNGKRVAKCPHCGRKGFCAVKKK